MPLIVPLLRISLLFLNVYQTFKTLKLPKPSSRNGRPSVRAMTQRKRDMKGCMAVWLVWCCFAVFERTLDGVLHLFVPFYGELKAIVLAFLIITRAKGAEPIYLHVIRPLVKPYVTTLDWFLDLAHMTGDFVLLLLSLPITMFMDWWQKPTHERETTIVENTTENQVPLPIPSSEQRRVSSGVLDTGITAAGQQNNEVKQTQALRTRTRRHLADTFPQAVSGLSLAVQEPGHRQIRPTTRAAAQPAVEHPRVLQPSVSQHKIWYPPDFYDIGQQTRNSSSSSTDERRVSPSIPPMDLIAAPTMDTRPPLPVAPRISSYSVPNNAETSMDVDDSRLYPPFPSAYPATPAPAFSSLPELSLTMPPIRLHAVNEEDIISTNNVPMTRTVNIEVNGHISVNPRPTFQQSSHSLPVRARDHGLRSNRGQIEVDEQGFGGSLERQRESNEDEDSGLRGGSSDENSEGGRSLQRNAYQPWDIDAEVGDLQVYIGGDATTDGEENKNENEMEKDDLDSAVDLDETIRDISKFLAPNDQPLLRARLRQTRRIAGESIDRLQARRLIAAESTSTNSISSSGKNSRTSSFSTGDASLRTMSRQISQMSRSSSSGSRSQGTTGSESDASSLAGRKRPRIARVGSKDSFKSSISTDGSTNAPSAGGKATNEARVTTRRRGVPSTTTRGKRLTQAISDDDATQSENALRDQSRSGRAKAGQVDEEKEPMKKRRRVAPLERTNLPLIDEIQSQEDVRAEASVVSKKGRNA